MNKKLTNSSNVRLFRYLVSLDSHKRTYHLKIVDVITEDILFNSAVHGSIDDTIAVLQKPNYPRKAHKSFMKPVRLVITLIGVYKKRVTIV